MKLLMLNYEFPPIGGGGGLANWNLIRCLAGKEDLRIDLVTSAPARGLALEVFADNITIHRIGIDKVSLHHWKRSEAIKWLQLAGRYYRKIISGGNYDLVHAFFAFPTGYLCWRTWRKLRYLLSLRGSDVPGPHARLRLDYIILAPLMRAIWSRASGIVACSQGLKERALRFLPSVKIEVIPNGVDPDRFYPAARALPDRPILLLTVGRLSVTKRIELLIKAIAILRQAGLDARLTIVGAGPMEYVLRRMVEDMRLSGVVILKGLVTPEDMPGVYRDHHIFVTATSQEGMSNAMLEAMASGLPVITTDCEGVDELIVDNGLVVPEPTPEAFAKNILMLANNKQMVLQMSRAGRERALMFCWDRIAQQYLDLYARIMRRQDVRDCRI